MSSLLDELMGVLRGEFARLRNRPFLDAAMAASALVATADGVVSFAERTRLDGVIERVRQLEVFEPHEAVDAFDYFVDAIQADAHLGREKAIAAITGFADKPEEAGYLMRIARAVALADQHISEAEQRQLEELKSILSIS